MNSLRKQVQLQAEELSDLRKMISHSREVEELLQQAHTQMVAQLKPEEHHVQLLSPLLKDTMRRHCQQLMEENQVLKTASDNVVSEHFLSQTTTDISE